jgi:hypothetical protein
MSMFAYHQLILAIKNRANKKDVAVCEMNPTYTSQIGKLSIRKRHGISIHPTASYVIARRVIGFKGKTFTSVKVPSPKKIAGLHH